MFYIYLRNFVAFLLWMLNGNAHYHNKDKILDPSENYILVAPHRTWWDPVYMAFATKPKEFIFMAKKSSLKMPFSAIGLRSVVPSRLTGIIQAPVQSNTPQKYSKPLTVH